MIQQQQQPNIRVQIRIPPPQNSKSGENKDSRFKKVNKLLSKYTEEGQYDEAFFEYEESTCCICIEEFSNSPTIIDPTPGNGEEQNPPLITKVKRCGHIFHSVCIRSWLTSSKNVLLKDPRCPLCNLSIKDPPLEAAALH